MKVVVPFYKSLKLKIFSYIKPKTILTMFILSVVKTMRPQKFPLTLTSHLLFPLLRSPLQCRSALWESSWRPRHIQIHLRREDLLVTWLCFGSSSSQMACFDLSKLSGIRDAVPLATVPPLHPPQHQSKRFLSWRLALLAGES